MWEFRPRDAVIGKCHANTVVQPVRRCSAYVIHRVGIRLPIAERVPELAGNHLWITGKSGIPCTGSFLENQSGPIVLRSVQMNRLIIDGIGLPRAISRIVPFAAPPKSPRAFRFNDRRRIVVSPNVADSPFGQVPRCATSGA